MTAVPVPDGDLLALYDAGLAQVYGYLRARLPSDALAEDLTSETFMAAVAARRRRDAELSVGWLITVARNKLVDHWRRQAREERSLRGLHDPAAEVDEPWDAALEAARARGVLDRLAAQHRAALTLRYLDGLPVVQVATLLGRTVHATEALLVRARRAFRRVYEETDA